VARARLDWLKRMPEMGGGSGGEGANSRLHRESMGQLGQQIQLSSLSLCLSVSVADPKLFILHPDPTCQVASDPDPIHMVVKVFARFSFARTKSTSSCHYGSGFAPLLSIISVSPCDIRCDIG